MRYFRCLIHLQRWKSFKSAGKTGTLKDRASDEGQASRTVDDALKVVLEEMRVRSRILARPLRPRRRGQPNFQGQRSPPRRLQGSPEPLIVLRHEFQHDSQTRAHVRCRAQGGTKSAVPPSTSRHSRTREVQTGTIGSKTRGTCTWIQGTQERI